MRRQIGDRAVVLGASMAGLLAARVLADAYGQVPVIDRDELPGLAGHRRGVPHGRHVHGLAPRGSRHGGAVQWPHRRAGRARVPAGTCWPIRARYFSGNRLRQAHNGLGRWRQPNGAGRLRAARVRALPNVASWTAATWSGWPRHPRWRVTGARLSAGPTAGRAGARRRPGRDATVRAPAPRCGCKGSVPRPETSRCGSGWAMRPGLPAAARRPRRRPGDPARAPPEHPRAGALQVLEGDR